MQSDAELVQSVLNGRVEAYRQLVKRYERSVRAATLCAVSVHEVAEGIDREVFVQAYPRLGSLRHGRGFGSWIVERAYRQARQQATNRSPAPAIDPLNETRIDPQEQRFLEMLMRLPGLGRMVLMLRHFDGHNSQFVAAMLGLPVEKIDHALAAATQRLNQGLTQGER